MARGDLLGFWPLDGDGRSEMGNAAETMGGATASADRSGKPGGAVSFDGGKSQYLSVPGGGGLDGLARGTISLWVKWTANHQPAGAGQTIFGPVLGRQCNGLWSSNLLGLSGTDPASARIRWRAGYRFGAPIDSAVSPGLDRWHHVAVTFAPGRHRLFVDGRLEASGAEMGPLDSDPLISLSIGAWIGDGNAFAAAAVDDLAIWDEPLSPERIAMLAADETTPLEIASSLQFEDATNYKSLAEVHIPREHIRRNPLQSLEFTRDTLVLVERAAPRPEFRERLDELEGQVAALIRESGAQITGKTAGAGTPTTGAAPVAGRRNVEYRRRFAELTGAILRLRREIVFSHPALDFDRLLINKRPAPNYLHQSRQYLGRYSPPGQGLAVLSNWKDQPQVTLLLHDKLPPGAVLNPDLSFDGRRILFSFCDHSESVPERRCFLVYEIGVDGRGLRRVTGGPNDPLTTTDDRQTAVVEDFDPCYLPDGGFLFTSTRQQAHIRCQYGGRYFANFVLHRGELEDLERLGPRISRISFNEAPEWEPSVRADGSVLYTRWDYINRHWNWFQSLWLTRPDGTGVTHVYGNYTRSPCVTAEPRAVPGSEKIVVTASAHHGYTAGSLILIDPRLGSDGPGPVTRLTPEVTFPESEYVGATPEQAEALIHSPQGIANGTAFPLYGAYCNPYPLSEDLFLVAYTPSRLAREGQQQGGVPYGIFLLDSLGGLEPIYRDPAMSSFSPLPIVARTPPPVLPSTIAPERKDATGVYYVHDVYESTENIPAGKVKSLRVVQILEQTVESPPSRGKAVLDLPKIILGTVPVEADGSVAFQAPARTMLALQLLDEKGMAVMGMRTSIYLQPGEVASCIGCHEPRSQAPRSGARTPAASSYLAREPITAPFPTPARDLTPPAGPRYEGGLSFTRTVQPVLDRSCIGCHGLQRAGREPAGGIILLGTMKDTVLPYPDWPGPNGIRVSAAYESLVSREGLISVAQCNYENDRSTPCDYYAHGGRLARMLLAGHPDERGQPRIQLDAASFDRIVQWLDLNAIFYGDYSWNKAEWRTPDPDGERQLRAYIREIFPAPLGDELAAQPFETLVNVSLPSESRILLGPLSKDAGGWATIGGGPWESKQSIPFRRMGELVETSIQPWPTHDRAGGCGQTPCRCDTCWVREAREAFLKARAEN